MNRIEETGLGAATESASSTALQELESTEIGRPPATELLIRRWLTALSLDGWAVTAAFLAALLVVTGVIKRIPW